MAILLDSIQELKATLASSANPASFILAEAQSALARANANQSHNTYLWRDEAWTLAEAHQAAVMYLGSAAPRPSFCGVPLSVKDCFDLSGSPTSCGTRFYRELHAPPEQDSWLVQSLRAAGSVITGKTHLHPLAYGITGENPEFGDCLQPENAYALTGGSSSGAAASVQERSAYAAIGTDTGGSVRVPAALCGLAGYRASHGRGDWRGAAHLAPSFDTFGWLFRDLADGPLLGSLFGPTDPGPARLPSRFAIIPEAFLYDCEPAVIASYYQSQAELASLGLTASTVEVDWWSDSLEIFAAIQAHEAAQIYAGHFAECELSIRQRLEWGQSLSSHALAALRLRHQEFRQRMDELLRTHDLLLLPAAPVIQLKARADHSQTRTRLLRYTSPISLAGMPAVTLPFFSNGQPSGGMQLVAAREDDARLLAFGAKVGALRKTAHKVTPPAW